MRNLSAFWRVSAGLISGQADPQYGKVFELFDDERRDGFVFHAAQKVAQTYAQKLEVMCATGGPVNWVRIDFVWL